VELDQPALQLILNVVMITGVTSLALICHLLKRDNQKLALELTLRREEDRRNPKILTAQAAFVCSEHEDIRQYVAVRKHDWIGPPVGHVG
jgi:hypothetical protein